MSGSVKNRYLDSRLLSVAAVLFGFLYIPAFIYGYFWLWVFPFTAITTLFLRSLLDSAIESVSAIADEGKVSRAMSFRLFGINAIQIVACAFPFVLVLWLNGYGLISSQEASATDKSLYGFVLSFFPENRLPQNIDFSNGIVQVVLSCSY